MNSVVKYVAALLIFSTFATAQAVIDTTGTWMGATKSVQTGIELEINAKISDSNGIWRYSTSVNSKKPGPCLNRDLPLSIKTLSSGKMLFSVDGASLIAGCPSFTVTFERTDDQTLTGAFGDGRAIILKKK